MAQESHRYSLYQSNLARDNDTLTRKWQQVQKKKKGFENYLRKNIQDMVNGCGRKESQEEQDDFQDSAIFERLGKLLMLMIDEQIQEEKRMQGLGPEGKD